MLSESKSNNFRVYFINSYLLNWFKFGKHILFRTIWHFVKYSSIMYRVLNRNSTAWVSWYFQWWQGERDCQDKKKRAFDEHVRNGVVKCDWRVMIQRSVVEEDSKRRACTCRALWSKVGNPCSQTTATKPPWFRSSWSILRVPFALPPPKTAARMNAFQLVFRDATLSTVVLTCLIFL